MEGNKDGERKKLRERRRREKVVGEGKVWLGGEKQMRS
jgi:hypothetical protein